MRNYPKRSMTPVSSVYPESEALKNLAQHVLDRAQGKEGVTAAEVSLRASAGLSVSVRLGEIDTLEFSQDRGLEVSLYCGHRKGSASTTEFSDKAIGRCLETARAIASYTEEDPCSGLADPTLMASLGAIPELNLYYPWEITADRATLLAQTCEAAGLGHDPRIVNSEGASVTSQAGFQVYANSHGFVGGYPTTRHGLSCSLIGKEIGKKASEQEAGLQRDYEYTVARDPRDLVSAEGVGRRAAERTVRRLGARRINTGKMPVIFAAEVAGSLWGNFVAAISGGNLYRRSSFLLDALGKSIFPSFLSIHEDPFLLKGLASAPFDQEGVATKPRDIVSKGLLQAYFLGSYSARKLGLQTTANAGGCHNLIISPGKEEFSGLLKSMGRGLLVTELMGQGVNLVTGDYSRGAVGFWVERGEIQYPVEEITIAGNLLEMFAHIAAIGSDIDRRSGILTGSVFLEEMTVAGL